MKKITEAPEQDCLVDAVLADENWSSTSRALRTEALEAIRQRRRSLAFRKSVLRTSLATVLLCAVGGWAARISKKGHEMNSGEMNPTTSLLPSLPVKPAAEVPLEAKNHYISEEQMVAFFPPGSCVVAEINGQKELVFLEARNPKGETD